MDEQTRVQPLEGKVVARAAPPPVPAVEVRYAGPVTPVAGGPPAAAAARVPRRGRGVLVAAAVGLALVGGVGGFAVDRATSGSAGGAAPSTGTGGPAGTGPLQGPGGTGGAGTTGGDGSTI
jgi:hypothetical protein